MPRIDTRKFYLSAIKKHGVSAKGVNWLSKEPLANSNQANN